MTALAPLATLITVDPTISAQVAALVYLLVQAFAKPFIDQTVSDGTEQNNAIRATSIVLGAVLLSLDVLGRGSTPLTLGTVFDTVAAGAALGGGLTYAVAGAKKVAPKVAALRVAPRTAPEPPVAPTA